MFKDIPSKSPSSRQLPDASWVSELSCPEFSGSTSSACEDDLNILNKEMEVSEGWWWPAPAEPADLSGQTELQQQEQQVSWAGPDGLTWA